MGDSEDSEGSHSQSGGETDDFASHSEQNSTKDKNDEDEEEDGKASVSHSGSVSGEESEEFCDTSDEPVEVCDLSMPWCRVVISMLLCDTGAFPHLTSLTQISEGVTHLELLYH